MACVKIARRYSAPCCFHSEQSDLKVFMGWQREMENILSWLLWGAFIILMMRFGCGAHMFGHKKHTHNKKQADGHAEAIRWEHPHSAVDPVCHKTVDPRIAKTTIHSGDVFYFCSDTCRSAFEASPDNYVGGSAITRKTHVSQG